MYSSKPVVPEILGECDMVVLENVHMLVQSKVTARKNRGIVAASCFWFFFLLWWWRFEVNQEAWSSNNASVLFRVTLLMCVLNICGSSGVRRPDSPSLLLQEKPKQSRKTSTREIHIRATDALADLVNTGGSSESKQSDKPQKATDKASRAVNNILW